MGAILIKSENSKHLKLLSALAEQLGENVNKLTISETENIFLGLLIKKERTRKTVSHDSILKLIDSKYK